MKTYIYSTKKFNAILPQDATVDQIFMYGNLPVIPINNGKKGDLITLLTEGIFNTKFTGQIAQGQLVYFHADNGQVNATAAGGVAIGFALDAVSDAYGRLLFVPLAQVVAK